MAKRNRKNRGTGSKTVSIIVDGETEQCKDGSLYQDLKPHLPDAIARSKAMNPFDPGQPEQAACEMWKLFEVLKIE